VTLGKYQRHLAMKSFLKSLKINFVMFLVDYIAKLQDD